jgi:NTP pyrophosphatase (non-canonical NTP hydrolase)
LNTKNKVGKTVAANSITLAEMQQLIEQMYGTKDEARGTSGTFMWLMEEIGELAAELRQQQPGDPPSENLGKEFADVLAWLITIANVIGVDLTAAFIEKYGTGCPGCDKMICECADSEKP